MFLIGNVAINNRVLAAPLAGVTDKAFRIIARSCGCGMTFTEMISDMGLVYDQERTRRMADLINEERPIAVQIFGSEVEPMIKGAKIIETMGASIIDINMGCPTPKIIKNGEGSALMLDIEKSRTIIREVVKAVKVPVTIKMRKGWDDDHITCIDLAGAAEQEGASAVTLHPRTRMQFFSGQADWDMIKEMKKHVNIPVIGNGDIWTAQDALHMLDYTGCDAVMIGRAAMGNPFIFRETVELVENGRKIEPPTTEERISMAIKHLDLACLYKGELVAVREMRKHFSWYIKGMSGAAKIRQDINQATTKRELTTIIKRIHAGSKANFEF